MTTPDERTRALLRARELLLDIAHAPATAEVCHLRERAKAVLRHYPDEGLVSLIAKDSLWLE
ncbi:BPSL0761 family protein [Burkholderia pseudomallei]|uniref:BPSL0761 family protein n=1 Tax=Burkholderia pseudomallei TaxID=28450 RepID=UPI000AE39851|nr:BPSL0761 family protein [Burkholderia pseudomallei]